MAVPTVVGALLVQIRVLGVLSPFAAALCAALYSFGNGGLFAAVGSTAGLLIAAGSQAGMTAWVLAGLTLCHTTAFFSGLRIKSKLQTSLFLAFVACSVLTSMQSPFDFWIAVINGILAVILRQAYLFGLTGLAAISQGQPLSVGQAVSLGVLVLSAVMGTAGMRFLTLNLMHILIGCSAMILAICTPAAVCGCFGILTGFWAALCGGASIQIVSNLGLCALCSGVCGRLGKFGATLGFLLANALFTVAFMPIAQSLHLGEALLAAALFVAIPQHTIDTFFAPVFCIEKEFKTDKARAANSSASAHLLKMAEALDTTARALNNKGTLEKGAAAVAQRQLRIAAQEMNKTAHVLGKGESFDQNTERLLLHRLRLLGLEPTSVSVQKGNGGPLVKLEMEGCKGKSLCHGAIKKAVCDACGVPMAPDKAPCRSVKRSRCTLRYSKSQLVSIKGGVATAKRKDARVNGDVVSSCRLSGSRELFCLCDGMGSGTQAREAAVMAVNLIESYFEAGYSQDEVIVTVNQLLTLRQSEVFAAADLLLIDTLRMQARFIKTCAGPSFLIRDNKVSVVEMGALPMGVLDTVSPAVLDRQIRIGDAIVLVSDGVADAMQGEELTSWFERALAHAEEGRAADALVELARQKLGPLHDDMTAIVLRIVSQKAS
jgi:serine/threonine protein phosphatase PrpC